ncbi:MAG: hypothetical protein MUO82_00650, partial [Candidatus Thermoplasmatota archaeon]|nr:hypothetical protein [Candidatus Thermoplasmatota archaeon]
TQLLRVSPAIFLELRLITFSIKICSPVAPLMGRRMPAACDKKRVCFSWRKIEMRLFICGSYADASDHAVFPVATINKNITKFF